MGVTVVTPNDTTLLPTPRMMATSEARGTLHETYIRSPSPSALSAPRFRRRTSTTPIPSSLAPSPNTSREPSPVRHPGIRSAAPRTARSRKNSRDHSPHRAQGPSTPSVPSAAAVQRVLSASGTPKSSSTTAEFTGEAGRPSRYSRVPAAVASQERPIPAPRLRSPPPPSIRSSTLSPRIVEFPSSAPSITLSQATPRPATGFDRIGEEEDVSRAGKRGPSKASAVNNFLETVHESTSSPADPTMMPAIPRLNTALEQQSSTNEESQTDSPPGRIVRSNGESGSESGPGGKARGASRKSSMIKASVRPAAIHPRKSFSQLNVTRNKIASEGSVKNMTVETETVSSVPQVAMVGVAAAGNPARLDVGGSIRTRPSTETIRPRKEKKKTARKAPSLHSGTASSKADIFEAKVASAVDEADSSDSEETFVYESNPPEPRPHHRYHSRTPSTTSVASQVDYYGGRYRHDGHNSIVGKKSMKFTNSHHLAEQDRDDDAAGRGGGGGGGGKVGSGRHPGSHGSQHHHHHHHQHPHHIGRYGRHAGHTSLFDADSPFPTTRSLRTGSSAERLGPLSAVQRPLGRAAGPNPYDFEGEGADDERTPLFNPTRSPRFRHGRRSGARAGGGGGAYTRRCWSTCRRMTGCLVLGALVGFLVAAVGTALVLCSKPLVDVQIRRIENVLASEQEIMLDLNVRATNPNLVAIQISELDVYLFANSKYVGSTGLLRGARNRYGITDGIDEGTDPIEEPGAGTHKMLLGQVLAFDSPLIFEGSPFRHQQTSSTGQIHLAGPGNQTEAGGPERWERVMQHPFELIVRGQLRYSLPISSRLLSAPISSVVIVLPESPADPPARNSTRAAALPFAA